ncbi:MAG: protein-glutamate O-methyltransferase CheR [Candidatus Omnitrophica bacterium]|nr:protein-glutamate O-methyltransferase CheR [Candidatus Omnitrophota bacterium]
MTHKSILSDKEVDSILAYIRRNKSVDLASYRRTFVVRRLSGRMENVSAETGGAYLNILRDDPEEFGRFLETLSINVTGFFRDPGVFEFLQKAVLPEFIRKKKAAGRRIMRIWSAGCASGEEPYSIAIMARGITGDDPGFEVAVHATDIDTAALKRAQEAVYPGSSLGNAGKKVLEKYFTPVYNGEYLLKDEIKKSVHFKRQNLISDPVLKHMDMVFCRNMMIYLSTEEKDSLIGKFNESLNTGGYLVVGKVESVWNNRGFETVSTTNKVYRKTV